MIKGIHHISAFTKSAAKNEHFYTEILGLRLVKNTVHQENQSIRHLFYGDYQGNPGTLLSFFELDKAGNSYLENNYFSTVTLKVPKRSLPFWEIRLNDYNIETEYDDTMHHLCFEDYDGFSISLVETDELISKENTVLESDIPRVAQIMGIHDAVLKVERPNDTLEFFTQFTKMTRTKKIGQVTNETGNCFTTVKRSSSAKPTRFGRGAIDHIAYSVASEEELKDLYRKAEEQNWTIEMYADRGYFKSLYLKEPNGLRIEFATMEPGFTLDEDLETLGDAFSLPNFLKTTEKKTEIQLEGEQ